MAQVAAVDVLVHLLPDFSAHICVGKGLSEDSGFTLPASKFWLHLLLAGWPAPCCLPSLCVLMA